MKKIFSLLLVVLMLSVCMVPAFAAGTSVTVGTDTGAAGDEVTVTFSIPETTFATFAGTVTYDPSVLTLESLTGGSACPGTFVGNKDNGMVSNLGFADETKSGVLFTATFTIKEGAEAGTYAVGFDIINFTKADTSAVNAASTAGSVTVEGSTPPTEEPSAPPTEEPSTPPTEEPSTPPSEEPSTPPTEQPTTPPVEPSTPVAPSDPTVSDKTGDNVLPFLGIGIVVLAAAAVIFTRKQKA